MLIAILVFSAMSFVVSASYVACFVWAIVSDVKEKKEARKKASEKKEQDD